MDAQLDKIRARIEKLTEKQHRIEEKYITSVARLVKNMANKGVDIKTIAGMILNAEQIISESQDKKEAWQKAGEKFLFKSKNNKPRQKQPENRTTQK